MNNLPAIILVAGFAMLALMGVAAATLVLIGRREKMDRRILAVLGPHQPAVAAPPPRTPVLTRLRESQVASQVAWIFGLRLDRAADYPIRWWIVPAISLPLARMAAGILAVVTYDWVVFTTPVLWVLMCRYAYGLLDERRMQILFRQFPDALGMVTRAVRVGIPVTESIRSVAREAPKETVGEFRRIADRLSIGMPLDRALSETALRNGVAEYSFFSTALSLQSQTGGGLSETLDNLAEVIRRRVALRSRAYALAAEARASAIILAALPFITLFVLALINPEHVLFLAEDPTGRKLAAIAFGLIVLGVAIMRNMIRRSLG